MSATENHIIAAAEARLAELEHLGADETLRESCWKCAGRKYIAGFGHVLNGICFECDGVGFKTRTVKNVRASLRRTITVERKSIEESARIRAERDAVRETWAAANPDVVEALANRPEDDYFMAELAAKLDTFGQLSEKQAEAVRKTVARQAERKAADEAAEDVPTGRVVVTGAVLSTKAQEGYHGSTTYKMLVRDDRGFKVWGTIPDAIFSVEKGDRVTFTATLEPSSDDRIFGFYKRPAKASIIEAAA